MKNTLKNVATNVLVKELAGRKSSITKLMSNYKSLEAQLTKLDEEIEALVGSTSNSFSKAKKAKSKVVKAKKVKNVKNKAEGKKRGRPVGSKNKPKTTEPDFSVPQVTNTEPVKEVVPEVEIPEMPPQ